MENYYFMGTSINREGKPKNFRIETIWRIYVKNVLFDILFTPVQNFYNIYTPKSRIDPVVL